jgi:two-component system, chemotaxis family, chemotaxis protein CheY
VAGRVLLVEDDSVEAEALGLILSEEGYGVVRAANGREALAHLAAHPAPDLILLDMIMPVMDGWQFLRERKHSPESAGPPVLVITSTLVIGREWAVDHGCAGWLRKPVDADELLQEVRRCLNG